MSSRKDGHTPYSVADRKERSKDLAQKRRTTYKSIMDDLTQTLPFPKDVVSQLDYNSRLRLTLCFFRLKTLLADGHDNHQVSKDLDSLRNGTLSKCESKSSEVVQPQPFRLLQPGMLQSMIAEALDGFLLVASSEGTIIYLSESIHHHLGIFQSEHIGVTLYDIISVDDHKNVRETITNAETKALSFNSRQWSIQVEFFCQMKCSRFRVANTITKSPGFKVVFVSGSIKFMNNDNFLVTVVRPINPPSVLEIRMEANMFVTHYDLELMCVFFDERLKHLLGYSKQDMMGVSPFHLFHHEAAGATVKCGKGVVTRGEGLSGYYRFMTQFGFYLWVQTKGTLMHDSCTGKPTYMVCLNYVISKDQGEKDLLIRQAITASLPEGPSHSYDPFPVTQRGAGLVVNPLSLMSWHHKKDFDDFDIKDFLAYGEDGAKVKEHVSIIKEVPQIKELKESGIFSLEEQCHSQYSSSSNVLPSSDVAHEGRQQQCSTNSPIYMPDLTCDLPDSALTISSVEDASLNGHPEPDAFRYEDSSSPQTFLGEECQEQATLGQALTGQGHTPTGQAPLGQVPLGQDSLGQVPQEQIPLGQGLAPLGQDPLGQAPLGEAPLGEVQGHYHGDFFSTIPSQGLYMERLTEQQNYGIIQSTHLQTAMSQVTQPYPNDSSTQFGSANMTPLPQLTGEDLEVLDLGTQ